MPEELVKPEELSKYRQVASHVVSVWVFTVLETALLFCVWGGRASMGSAEYRAVPGSWHCSWRCFLPGLLSCQGSSSCPVVGFPVMQ